MNEALGPWKEKIRQAKELLYWRELFVNFSSVTQTNITF